MNRLKILNNANEHVISQLSEKYFDICESDKKRLLAVMGKVAGTAFRKPVMKIARRIDAHSTRCEQSAEWSLCERSRRWDAGV